tara:strand:+ start:2122 stop:2739 length:618 start_codon:yes stop_codon:yes gene_type:complete
MFLAIDGNKYRETICKPNVDNCYFAIPVNNRDLNVSYFLEGYSNNIPYLSCKYHYGFIINDKIGYNDKLIKNDYFPLLQTEYYYSKNHILNLVTLITLEPLNLKQPELNFEIYFNDLLEYNYLINTESPIVSHKLEIIGYDGFNSLKIGLDTKGVWCSCPSMGTGFENSRYILAWVSDNNEPERISIGDKNYIQINIGEPEVITV